MYRIHSNIIYEFAFKCSIILSLMQCSNAWQRRIGRVNSYSSITEPQFDRFLQSVLGQWKFLNNKDGESNTKFLEVEEVMRSCGGAVQGLRETKKEGESLEQTWYHNRADDGFLFFDDGTYASGPTVLKDKDKNAPFLVSFSFDSNGTKRVILSYEMTHLVDNCIPVASVTLDALARVSAPLDDPEDMLLGSELAHPSTYNCYWENEIICRMSSSTEKWLRPRAKWEACNYPPSEFAEEIRWKQPIRRWQGTQNGFSAWIHVINNSCSGDSQPLSSYSSSQMVFDSSTIINEYDSEAIISQVGVVCWLTGEVRSFIHSYSKAGFLQAVVFRKGNIVLDSVEMK